MTVHFTRNAFRQLADLPKADRDRMTADLAKLEALLDTANLANTARAIGVQVTALVGAADAYRVRRGNYRAVFSVTGGEEITVEAIGHRRDIYD